MRNTTFIAVAKEIFFHLSFFKIDCFEEEESGATMRNRVNYEMKCQNLKKFGATHFLPQTFPVRQPWSYGYPFKNVRHHLNKQRII